MTGLKISQQVLDGALQRRAVDLLGIAEWVETRG